MKFAPTIVLPVILLIGCSGDVAPPTGPTPPAPVSSTPGGNVWVTALDGYTCIVGATVEIVGGENVGQSQTQTIPCDYWSPSGVLFTDLKPGVEVTAHVSARGYVAQDLKTKPAPLPMMTTYVFLEKK
jgi:hypothetical protein